jgi:hypothetical protein
MLGNPPSSSIMPLYLLISLMMMIVPSFPLLIHQPHLKSYATKDINSISRRMPRQKFQLGLHAVLPRFGQSIDARNLSREDFQRLYDGKLPVLLTNIFDFDDSASSSSLSMSREEVTERLISLISDKTILYETRDNIEAVVNSYECNLDEYLSILSDNSDHEDSLYFMSESILQEKALRWFDDAMRLPSGLFGINYFSYFPEKIKPRNALIIGGVGARSFLHVDPYGWTGWNYLLEGRKLCKSAVKFWINSNFALIYTCTIYDHLGTFLPPSTDKALLQAYANTPTAWDSLNLTCGYVSEVDLYRHMSGSSSQLSNSSTGILNNIWLDYAATQPHDPMVKRNQDIPYFQPDEVDRMSHHDRSHFESYMKLGAMQIVQEEGELIVFPAGYWHQVYHLEPSIAVASQYCNEVIMRDVFHHILSYSRGSPERIDEDKAVIDACEKMSPSDAVRSILKKSLTIRHGEEEGESVFRQIYQHSDNKLKKGMKLSRLLKKTRK